MLGGIGAVVCEHAP